MRDVLICTDCERLRAALLNAKEQLSVFVRRNGHKHDADVGTELRALVMTHQQALLEWDTHVDGHELLCDFISLRPPALRTLSR